ncbi:hypothetical protein C8J57DRAFT_1215237 [Mycena rebaudengoi]|nr:hypothetical protein C8J57DRAFT_1215237 [Mycena rebaudengoi]
MSQTGLVQFEDAARATVDDNLIRSGSDMSHNEEPFFSSRLPSEGSGNDKVLARPSATATVHSIQELRGGPFKIQDRSSCKISDQQDCNFDSRPTVVCPDCTTLLYSSWSRFHADRCHILSAIHAREPVPSPEYSPQSHSRTHCGGAEDIKIEPRG